MPGDDSAPVVGIFSYFAQIDEDGSGYLDIEEVQRESGRGGKFCVAFLR